MPAKQTHICGIDLLRFAAAMLVLLHHFGSYAASSPEVVSDPALRAYGFLHAFEGVGATGVEIFFVISGFVISMSTLSLTGVAGALSFAFARATRILPALWVSAAISFIALLSTGQDVVPLLDRVFRSAILSPLGPYIDGVVWSLVVEAVFYLVVGLAIAFTRSIPLVGIALALGVLSSLHLFVLLVVAIQGNEGLVALLERFPFKVFLLQYGVFFAIGMLLYHATRYGKRAALTSAMLVFAVFGIVEIALVNRANVGQAVGAVLVWLAGMAFLLGAIRWNSAVRPNRIMRLLGNMSYTIYLNHYTTGMVLVYALHEAGLAGPSSFVIALTSVLLISYIVLRAEKSIQSLMRAPIIMGRLGRMDIRGR